MAAQTDLVNVVGRFDPRIVRMAEAGERPGGLGPATRSAAGRASGCQSMSS